MPGVAFAEVLSGRFRARDRDLVDRPMEIALRGRSRTARAFRLAPGLEIEGAIDVEGFADHRLLRGAIELDALRAGRLRYGFSFTSNDGARCAFAGERHVDGRELAASFSVLSGVVRGPHGDELGRALLRFDVKRDLVRLLRSVRAWL